MQENEVSELVEELKSGKDRQLIAGLSGGAKPVFFKALQQSIDTTHPNCISKFATGAAYI